MLLASYLSYYVLFIVRTKVVKRIDTSILFSLHAFKTIQYPHLVVSKTQGSTDNFITNVLVCMYRTYYNLKSENNQYQIISVISKLLIL